MTTVSLPPELSPTSGPTPHQETALRQSATSHTIQLHSKVSLQRTQTTECMACSDGICAYMFRTHPPLTTTISSRERPRARQVSHAQRSISPDPRGATHLVPPSTHVDHSKSLDSGLDAFGDVPFAPSSQVCVYGVESLHVHPSPCDLLHTSMQESVPPAERPASAGRKEGLWMTADKGKGTPDHLRRDLFGATPFTSQVADSDVDAFGHAPFTRRSQEV